MIRHRRSGFTLVELTTVLVIIAVGLAIGLPAVQKSRADARRVQCSRNLRQIGLALHNYVQVFATLPPGWTGHSPEPGEVPRLGWIVSLLPFLDEAPLYQELDSVHHDMTNRKPLEKALPVLRCPADSTPLQNPLRGSFATSNYSGNFGTIAAPRWSNGDASRFWTGQLATPATTNGIFFLNSRIRFRDVRDGLSNTMMVGERAIESRAGIWMGVRGNEYEDDQVTDSSFGNEINTGDNSFSSRHQGGAHLLMGDGHVVFVSELIESLPGVGKEMGLFQKLADRDDRQRLPKIPTID